MNHIKKPILKPIKKGDTLGVIAPSSPVFPGLLESTIAYFEKEGYKIKIGQNIHKAELFSAGTDKERAQDIMVFFNDPDVSALITTNGGACSIRTLPLLDYDIIHKNPKPIIGYSDATALQLGIYAKTNCISFTGFNGSDIKDGVVNSRILSTLTHCLNNKSYSIEGGVSVNLGSVTAPLIGGNLMCLLNLMGTPFQPDCSNKILFIEDVGIEPYIIEGMFSQLYVAGVFEQAAGVIIGTFTDCVAKHFSNQGETTEDVINFWCNKIKIPCIKDFPYGHIDSRVVLPIGQMATLDASKCKLDIHF
jgi:muramoyltetrapeptide carboxypeptidase